jgi:hypothetical protein
MENDNLYRFDYAAKASISGAVTYTNDLEICELCIRHHGCQSELLSE